MHRCSCSTRALESFVLDFAGIYLRQQRAQRFLQHTRTFSTRPSVRQIETTSHTHPDDGFIPFKAGDDITQPTVSSTRTISNHLAGTQVSSQGSNYQNEHAKDAEWHAQVEIVGPVLHEMKIDRGAGTIDDIRLPDTLPEVTSNEHASLAVSMLDLPATSQNISQKPGHPSKIQSVPQAQLTGRMLRKARRIEAGTYKPSADAKLSVLDKIEMLEGPTTVKEVRKSDVKETKVKSTAQGSIDRKPKRGHTKRFKEVKSDSTKFSTPSRSPVQARPFKKETWQVQKAALDRKFAEQGWQPRKRLSPDTLEGIRALHASDPVSYSTAILAEHFQITPEAIRRVLRSKWQPKPEEIEARMKRWENRGVRKWKEMSNKGVKPPKKWRAMGVENPLLKKRIATRTKEHAAEAQWNRAEELAGKLPFEGSLAERIP